MSSQTPPDPLSQEQNEIVPLSRTAMREKLRKEIKKKKQQPSQANGINEDNLFGMLSQVNMMLKDNPEMVKKVSKCVNNIFENKELMGNLVSELETSISESK